MKKTIRSMCQLRCEKGLNGLMRSIRTVIVAGVLLAVTEFASVSTAQSNGGAKWSLETLDAVTKFVDANCPLPPDKGASNSVTGSAEANASLSALLKKLTDAGATIKAEATHTDYNGVTQDKLSDARKDAMTCRQNLIQLVLDRVLPPPSSEQSDSIQIVQATMTRRGDNKQGEDPSQHFVYGVAHVVYTGKGPYTSQRFTACLTSGNQSDGTSTCGNNSSYLLGSPATAPELGTQAYNFVVFLPNPWFPDNRAAQVMVCILDTSQNPFFALSREDRLSRPSPICDVKNVSFQD
jgi:hypothetical protein